MTHSSQTEFLLKVHINLLRRHNPLKLNDTRLYFQDFDEQLLPNYEIYISVLAWREFA